MISKFDVFAGWGMAPAFLTPYERQHPEHSIIKSHMGINGGVVYNATPQLHIDLDYVRAEANWFLGESQVLHIVNTGMTFNW